MDMDMAERGWVEWVSKFFPLKGSTHLPALRMRIPKGVASQNKHERAEPEIYLQYHPPWMTRFLSVFVHFFRSG